MSRVVHFVYLGGEFLWQHWRAIETAKVHDAPIVVWRATGEGTISFENLPYGLTLKNDPRVEFRELDLPDWLRDHPIQLANVKDYYAWRILADYGGLYLDLDTISLRPAWDLLTRDVCVSLEHERGFDAGHPYNSAVVLGKRGAPTLLHLQSRAEKVLERSETRWGKCGPHLLTEVVERDPESFDIAEFGVLNGWRDDTIVRYYEGERPGPRVRVVHLFSSSRPDLFRADRWMPGPSCPDCGGEQEVCSCDWADR